MAKAFVKQHIVPKRYLDRFATPTKKGKNLIGVRLDDGGKIKLFESTTDKVGFINNYYDVKEGEELKYWEHFFANRFDGLYGDELNKIISKVVLSQNSANILDDYDKEVLSKIIVSQLLRHPKNIGHIYKNFPDLKRRSKKILLNKIPKQLKPNVSHIIDNIEFTKKQSNDIYLNGVFDEIRFKVFCDVIKNKTWLIYQNSIPSRMPFTTSDNPVLVIEKGSDKLGVFNVGINNKDCIIFFPLSPTVAVQIMNPNDVLIQGLDNCKYYLNLKDIEFLTNMNTLSMTQAMYQSYLPLQLFKSIKEDDGQENDLSGGKNGINN